jgi:hypothetical protein
MRFWRQLAQNRLLDVGAGLIAALAVWRVAVVLPSRASAYDFAHHYTASRLLLEGENPYRDGFESIMVQRGFTIDPSPINQRAVMNSPLFLWLFTPLAAMGPTRACWGWVTVEATSLALVIWLTCRLLAGKLTRRARWFIAAAVVASMPVYWHFYFSQSPLLLSALVLVAFAQRQAGRSVLACLLVTLAGLLKMYPFVLLPWFVWRGPSGWPGRLRRAGAAAAVVAVVVLATGPAHWAQAHRQQRELVERYMVNSLFNETVPSFVVNLGMVVANAAWPRVGIVAGLLVIAAAYRRCGTVGGDDQEQFALLTTAMIAGIPYAWGHYLVFLIFPVAMVAGHVLAKPTPARVWWLVAAALALNNLGRVNFMLTDPWLAGHLWCKFALNYVPLAGVLATGAFLWREMGTKHA